MVDQSTETTKGDVEYTLTDAIIPYEAGDHATADRILVVLEKTHPDLAAVYYLRGQIALAREDASAAVEHFRASDEHAPKDPDVTIGLGIALEQNGQPEEAIALYDDYIAESNDIVEILFNRANCLRGIGDDEGSLSAYRDLLDHFPDYHQANINRGDILRDRGDLLDALDCYKQVSSEHALRCMAMDRIADVDTKLGEYRTAIDIYTEILNTFGATMDDESKVPVLFNRGHNHQILRQYPEAILDYERVLAIDPDFVVAHYNMGIIYHELHAPIEAARWYRKVQALDPKYVDAICNEGMAAEQVADLDTAIAIYNEALSINPRHQAANGNILYVCNYHPTMSIEEIHQQYVDWNDRMFGNIEGRSRLAFNNEPTPDRKIRVGYVSGDFMSHVSMRFIPTFLENHDRSSFHLTAYGNIPTHDRRTEEIIRLVDQWRDVLRISDDKMVEQIIADEIDILVDLSGHTGANRLGVFARRAAPVQITYLGYGFTTGVPAIDYILADDRYVPEGHEGLFCETVWRLPRTFLCLAHDLNVPADPELPAKRNGYVTFGHLGRLLRMNDDVLKTWSQILARVPNSKLMLNTPVFREPDSLAIFKAKLMKNGISEDRLDIRIESPPWGSYRDMDISLDPFPHNAGATTIDALMMGCPVISLKDRVPMGRFGASILGAIDRSEWVADTRDEYIEKACEMASNLEELADIRAGLRDHVVNSPLMDSVTWTQNLEDAYRAMWRIWCEEKSG